MSLATANGSFSGDEALGSINRRRRDAADGSGVDWGMVGVIGVVFRGDGGGLPE